MDEKIRKIEKEVAQGKNKKAQQDLKVLERLDIKRDKEMKHFKKAKDRKKDEKSAHESMEKHKEVMDKSKDKKPPRGK